MLDLCNTWPVHVPWNFYSSLPSFVRFPLPSSGRPCSFLIPLFCHRPSVLWSFPDSAIIPHLWPRLPTLSSSCSFIGHHLIPLLHHHPYAPSSSILSAIVPMLCHCPYYLPSSLCSAIIAMLCHRRYALSSSLLSAIVVPMFCHRILRSVIVHLLYFVLLVHHYSFALLSSPCTVIVIKLSLSLCFVISFLFCDRPYARSVTVPLSYHSSIFCQNLSDLPSVPSLYPCSVIVPQALSCLQNTSVISLFKCHISTERER